MLEDDAIRDAMKVQIASALSVESLTLGRCQLLSGENLHIKGFWVLWIPGVDRGFPRCAAKIEHDRGTDLFFIKNGEVSQRSRPTTTETPLDAFFRELRLFDLNLQSSSSLGSGQITYAAAETQNWQLRTSIKLLGSISIQESGVITSMDCFERALEEK